MRSIVLPVKAILEVPERSAAVVEHSHWVARLRVPHLMDWGRRPAGIEDPSTYLHRISAAHHARQSPWKPNDLCFVVDPEHLYDVGDRR
jgi:hypothetical protein